MFSENQLAKPPGGKLLTFRRNLLQFVVMAGKMDAQDYLAASKFLAHLMVPHRRILQY
jgi:hypothetical protein